MKKRFMEQEGGLSRCVIEQENLMKRDWYSLGARAPYWSGSPWRAVAIALQKELTA